MRRIKLLLSTVLGLSGCLMYGQGISRDVLRTDASECFTSGDFQCAAEKYTALIDIYPKDPLYNYYLGASLARINTDLDKAIVMLDFAAIRYVPGEVVFYQGLARHWKGEYAKALEYYRKYRNDASRKMASNLQVEKMIQLAEKGELPAPFINTAVNKEIDLTKEVPVVVNNKPQVEKVPVKKEDPVQLLSDTKPVTAPVDNSPEESGYIAMLNEALKYQMRSDSLVREIERKRSDQTITDAAKKKVIWSEINSLQTEADDLQNKANVIYSKARELELKMVAGTERSNSKATIALNAPNTLQANKPRPKIPVNSSTKPTDSLLVKRFYYNDLALLPESPYNEAHPIPIDDPLPGGILYKIQLAVLSKPILMNKFGGLSPISGEIIPANGTTRYYAGLFSALREAEKALEKVRNAGYREAFIVSFYNGKKISLIRAREIEQMLKTNE